MTIYCIGRNYVAHAKELNNPVPEAEPVVFLKSEAAQRGIESAPVAFAGEEFHHEAELVVRVGRDIALGQAGDWDDVSHLALGLDVTRRSVQTQLKAKGLPWTTAKSFAGSAVVSPLIQKEMFSDLNAIIFTLHINGTLKQRGAVSDMIFPIPSLLTYLASLNDLRAGDLIFTGTPEGVGPLRCGDSFRLSFEREGIHWTGSF
jgi:2-keto-4-pentenoate hydratase/2-oxohepta-3-ene-1,7-dioic acid hydratase in catechol pathway